MKTWMSLTVVLVALSGCKDGGAIAGGEDAGPVDASDAEDAQQGAGDATALDAGAGPTVAYLSPTQHLLRASVVLRGSRPILARNTRPSRRTQRPSLAS